MASVSVSSESYDGRYFKFTVTQSGTSTSVNWTFEVLGGSDLYYTASPINCSINGVSVYSVSSITYYDAEKFPAAKGSKSGTYNIGSYGSFTVALSGRPYYHSATSKSATLTLTKPTYTISYNANGGSGAPSSQTKTYGTALELSSTKPTRTGYTFNGWNTASDGSGTSYSSGDSYTANSAVTLYAQWEENYLTINYYSNYADYGKFNGEVLSDVKAGSNVLAYTHKYYYDNAYSDGLYNIQNSEKLYLTRTGYTSTLHWGTSTSGGTLIDQYTAFDTGQALAQALGKDLSSSNATINIYAQWEENVLTVNYYSNYATSAFDGALNTVGADKNVHVHTSKIYYDNDYSEYGLANYSGSSGSAYMTRTGYTATGNWGTSTSGGKLIHEDDKFSTGQALALVLGKDISENSDSINIYAQWRPNVLTIKYNVNRGVINSDKYYIDNDLIGLISSSTALEDKWNYNDAHENGLYNASTFGLAREGYKFIGWKVGSSGTRVFDQDDSSVLPTDLASNITTGDRTITLYAVWEISGVIYIDNGTTFEPYLAYIDNGSSWDLYIAYIDDGVEWNIIS